MAMSSAIWYVASKWVIIQGAVVGQTFQTSPYDMLTGVIGNRIGITPMTGSILSTFIGGWVCDVVPQAMTIRNKYNFEPKFRLVVVLLFLVVTIVGFSGLGLAFTPSSWH